MTTPQTLLQYIAANPGIRAIELADQFDTDIETVAWYLAPYIGTEVEAKLVVAMGQSRVVEYRMMPPAPAIEDKPIEVPNFLKPRVKVSKKPAGCTALDLGRAPSGKMVLRRGTRKITLSKNEERMVADMLRGGEA